MKLKEIFKYLRQYEDFEEHRWYWGDFLTENHFEEDELINIFREVISTFYTEEYRLEHLGLDLFPEVNPFIEALISYNHEHKYLDDYSKLLVEFDSELEFAVNKVECGGLLPVSMLLKYRDIVNWPYQSQFIAMNAMRTYHDEYYYPILRDFKKEILYVENWVAYQTECLFVFSLHLGVNFTVDELKEILLLDQTSISKNYKFLRVISKYLSCDVLDEDLLTNYIEDGYEKPLNVSNIISVLNKINEDEELLLYLKLI